MPEVVRGFAKSADPPPPIKTSMEIRWAILTIGCFVCRRAEREEFDSDWWHTNGLTRVQLVSFSMPVDREKHILIRLPVELRLGGQGLCSRHHHHDPGRTLGAVNPKPRFAALRPNLAGLHAQLPHYSNPHQSPFIIKTNY